MIYETPTVSFQSNLQEGSHSTPRRHSLTGSTHTSGDCWCNKLWCIPHWDGTSWATKEPRADREHWTLDTGGNTQGWDTERAAPCYQQGWPNDKAEVQPPSRPYWNYRDELSVQNGIIYKGMQVMVPQLMHANHFGADSNIQMAREVLFWQGMRKAIQDTCDACGICAQYCRSTTKEPMKSLPVPSRPWEIVSQGICEQEN